MVKHPDEDVILDLCCGRKRCPVVRRKPGGFVVEDDDQRVELDDDQARKVADCLLAALCPRDTAGDVLQRDLHDAGPW